MALKDKLKGGGKKKMIFEVVAALALVVVIFVVRLNSAKKKANEASAEAKLAQQQAQMAEFASKSKAEKERILNTSIMEDQAAQTASILWNYANGYTTDKELTAMKNTIEAIKSSADYMLIANAWKTNGYGFKCWDLTKTLLNEFRANKWKGTRSLVESLANGTKK